MNTSMLIRVRKLFNNELAPNSINRHNQRQWIKSIRYLGSKWLLAQYQQRKEIA